MNKVNFSKYIMAFVVIGFLEPSLHNSASAKKLMCADVFSVFEKSDKIELSEKQVEMLNSVMDKVAKTTTGRRQEEKIVVSKDTIQNELENLAKNLLHYNIKVDLRETPREGFANWTETYYTTPFYYKTVDAQGQKVKKTVKARVRSYFEEDLSTGRTERLAITANKKFLELKAQNPNLQFTSDKARALLSDATIEKLLTQDLSFEELQKVKQEIYDEPVFNREIIESGEVENFIKIFQSTAFRNKNYKQKYVTTIYQRQAFRIRLYDGNSPIDIQMTVDRKIIMHKGQNGHIIYSYPNKAAVVEIKIPTEYAKMSDAQLQSIIGLAEVKTFIENLTAQVLEGFEINKGKFSTSTNHSDKK